VMNTSRRYNNKIDIVIVTYKCYGNLERCIASVYSDRVSRELIQDIFVVDNAPSPAYWEGPPELFDDVIIVRNRRNIGFARAANLGIIRGSAPYVLLLNPDTIVHRNMIARSVTFMDKQPKVGIMGPRVLNSDGSVQGSARSFPTPFSALFGRNTLLTKWFANNPMSCKNVLTSGSDGTTPMEVDWVSGACMMVRRKAIDDVGFMDERFFMYWEDADWCKRMWESRWKVVYFPKASMVHYVGGSSEKLRVRSILEFHKSSYYLFRKHSSSHLHFLMPLALVGLGLRALFVLATQWPRRTSRRPKGSMASGKFSSPDGRRISPV